MVKTEDKLCPSMNIRDDGIFLLLLCLVLFGDSWLAYRERGFTPPRRCCVLFLPCVLLLYVVL